MKTTHSFFISLAAVAVGTSLLTSEVHSSELSTVFDPSIASLPACPMPSADAIANAANVAISFPTPTTGLPYGGGSIIVNPTVYYIFYGTWNDPNDTTMNIITEFTKNLGGSDYWNILSTYSMQPSGRPKSYVSNTLKYGGSIVVSSEEYGTSLSDYTIYQIVHQQMLNSANSVTPSLPVDHSGNAIYLVISSLEISETSGFCTNYCGWHTDSGSFVYGFVGTPSCGGCMSHEDASQSPNGNVKADAMVSVISHEIAESASDPFFGGWVIDSSTTEMADLCSWKFDGEFTTGNGSKANMTLANGKSYLVQDLWVNLPGSVGFCSMSYLSPVAQIAAIPSIEGTPSLTVQFNGSASYDPYGLSISTYAWDFGDGTSTVTGAQPTHIYTTHGNFIATLTVSNANGQSGSTSYAVVHSTLTTPANLTVTLN